MDPEKRTSLTRFIHIWNRGQGQSTPWHHLRMAYWLDRCTVEGKERLLLMAFRGAGKSTVIALYCAWLVMRDPNKRILVVAAEQSLAGKLVRNVARIIEAHPMTAALKPERPDMWRADQITVIRSNILRDPTILARGLYSNLTGSRAEVVICDDVEVPNTAGNHAARLKMRERLQELQYILTPRGTQTYVGTPHAYHSIYSKEPRPELGEDHPYLVDFERKVMPVIKPTGEPTWPQVFDIKTIEDRRRQLGSNSFRAQMMLEPVDPRLIRLDPDKLLTIESPFRMETTNGAKKYLFGDKPMTEGIACWDPSFGKAGQSDGNALAIMFCDEDRHYFLASLDYIEMPDRDFGEDRATRMCEMVLERLEAFGMPEIIVETNGLGSFLPDILQKVVRKRGTTLRIRPQHSHRNKNERIISALDPLLETGRLHVTPDILSGRFVQEMREWRLEGQNADDGIDAVSMTILARMAPLPRFVREQSMGQRPFVAQFDFKP